MATIRTLKFNTALDLSGLEHGLKRMDSVADSVAKGVGAKLANIRPAADGIAGSLGKVELGFGSLAKAVSGMAIASAALHAVGDAARWVAEGVKAAGDLNESVGLTKIIFKDAAAGVVQFADQLASRVGAVKSEVLEVASGFGGIGSGANLAGKDLEDFTKKLVAMSGDFMAAKNITNLKTAADALKVALSGEQSDLLKQLGISLLEADVKAYAFSHGIAKVGDSLTQNQKVMARYGILADKLKFAQGNWADTINDTMPAFRRMGGMMTNLQAEVGGALKPMTNLIQGGAIAALGGLGSAFEAVRPHVEGFVTTMATNLRAVFDYIGPAVGGYAAKLAEAWGGVGSALGSLISSALPSLASVAEGIKGFALTATAGVGNLMASVRDFPAFIERSFGPGPQALLSGLGNVVASLGRSFGALLGTGVQMAGFSIRNFGNIADIVMLAVGGSVNKLVGIFALIPTNLGRIASFVGGNWLDMMVLPFKTLGRVVAELGRSFVDFLKNPAGGVHLNIDGIMADYQALAAKLPEMAVAKSDIGGAIDEKLKAIRQNEAAYKAAMGKPFALPKPVAPGVVAQVGAGAQAKAMEAKSGSTVEATQDLQSFASSFVDSIKSPAEKFAEIMEKSTNAYRAHLLNDEQFGKAKKVAREDSGVQAMLDTMKTPAEKFAKEMLAVDELLKKSVVNQAEYDKLRQGALKNSGVESILDSIKSPFEKLDKEVLIFSDLLNRGVVNQEAYNKLFQGALKNSGIGAVIDSIKTPAMKFAEAMEAADEAFKGGLIDSEEYGKFARKTEQETGLSSKFRPAAAMELGSREANSAVVSAMAGRSGGIGADVGRYTKQSADQLILLNRQIRDQVRAGNRRDVPKEIHI